MIFVVRSAGPHSHSRDMPGRAPWRHFILAYRTVIIPAASGVARYTARQPAEAHGG